MKGMQKQSRNANGNAATMLGWSTLSLSRPSCNYAIHVQQGSKSEFVVVVACASRQPLRTSTESTRGVEGLTRNDGPKLDKAHAILKKDIENAVQPALHNKASSLTSDNML